MLTINQSPVGIEYFPAGEQRLTFMVTPKENYLVEWKYEREDELVALIYLCGHIKAHGGILDVLYIPYLPNARMDRIVNPNEVFTLKYFCQMINTLGFAKIYVNNPHSDVSMGLLDNVENACLIKGSIYHNNDIIAGLINKLGLNEKKDILFYPDAGSAKKYENVLKFPFLTGHKHRDWHTGKITGFEIAGPIPSAPFDVLIIDDICSYGNTFLHAAKKLKEIGAEKIYLYVTHCENSVLQGELINSGLLEKIYTTGSIFTKTHPLVEIIKPPEDTGGSKSHFNEDENNEGGRIWLT